MRFGLAALVLAAIAALRGAQRGLERRAIVAGLLMGAIGYATQAGLYFSALDRMDASLLALLLYTYPALVVVLAIALGRESASSASRRGARPRLDRGGARPGRRGHRHARPARHGHGARRRGDLRRLHPGRRGGGGRRPAADARRARDRRRDVQLRGRRVRDRRTGSGLRARRLGLARRHRVGQHGAGHPHLLRGPRARRPFRRRDPLHPRAGGHRRPRRAGLRRGAQTVQLLGGAGGRGARGRRALPRRRPRWVHGDLRKLATTRASGCGSCCWCASGWPPRAHGDRRAAGRARGLERRAIAAGLLDGRRRLRDAGRPVLSALDRMDASLLACCSTRTRRSSSSWRSCWAARRRAPPHRGARLASIGARWSSSARATGTLDPLGTVMGIGAA